MRPEWHNHAACQGADPALFFPERHVNGTQAKRICATCPVRVECLTYALDTFQHHGIWGGTTDKDRRRIRRQQLQETAA